jgi:type II secretory pathway component PulJ
MAFHHKQNGYGLIETVIGLALTGILSTGITAFAVQTFTESVRSNNHMKALMQVENAGYWVSRDVQMSENLTLGEHAGFPLQLLWNDADGNEYQVTFTLTDGQIKRTIIENEEEPTQVIIAQSIYPSAPLTDCSYENGLITFNVTASLGNETLSRSYQIKKRLDLLQ